MPTFPRAAVIELLLGDSVVQAMSGGRIFGEMPESEDQHMPRAAIAVTEVGSGPVGPGARSYVPFDVTRMDIRVWGSSTDEASSLFRQVHRVMLGLSRTLVQVQDHQSDPVQTYDTVLVSASISVGPLSGRDPDTDWPFTLGSYEVASLEDVP